MANIFLDPQIDVPSVIHVINEQDPHRSPGYLSAMEVGHVTQKYVDGLSDADVRKFILFTRNHAVTEDEIKNYVKKNEKDITSLLMGFYASGQLRGTVRLSNPQIDTIDIGIAIFDKLFWGHSWATNIVRVVSNFAIDNYGFRAVRAGVDVNNTASRRVFEKCGFAIVSDKIRSHSNDTVTMEYRVRE